MVKSIFECIHPKFLNVGQCDTMLVNKINSVIHLSYCERSPLISVYVGFLVF